MSSSPLTLSPLLLPVPLSPLLLPSFCSPLLDDTDSLHISRDTVNMMFEKLIDDTFKCICGIERKSKVSIHNHIIKVHFKNLQIEKKQKKQVIKKSKKIIKVNCDNCNKGFTRENGLRLHLKNKICTKYDMDIDI